VRSYTSAKASERGISDDSERIIGITKDDLRALAYPRSEALASAATCDSMCSGGSSCGHSCGRCGDCSCACSCSGDGD
jgi:hypothetical protein